MKLIDYAELLDVFFWGLDKLTRPTMHNILFSYDEYASPNRRDRLLTGLEQQGLVEHQGRGAQATYRITAVGRQRASTLQLEPRWDQPWDGAWRVVTFDLPETRRQDRKRLWQALRARKLGLLQRSVWIWPHDLTPILTEIIHAEGIPECFCGFETRRLFLCTDAEVTVAAWDFVEIAKRQQAYLNHQPAVLAAVHNARDLVRLAGLIRSERIAYDHAFIFDPLLPRVLLPKGYLGLRVQQCHRDFRRSIRQKFPSLVTT
jgi:phenylacetic acid degradation operon negative regulatory protein